MELGITIQVLLYAKHLFSTSHCFQWNHEMKAMGHLGNFSLKDSVVGARKAEEVRGASPSLRPWATETNKHPGRCVGTPAFPSLPECSSLVFSNKNKSFNLDLPTLKLENISCMYQQHQWLKVDLAELISRETNQLEKCKFVFCTELETHYTEPLLKLSSK